MRHFSILSKRAIDARKPGFSTIYLIPSSVAVSTVSALLCHGILSTATFCWLETLTLPQVILCTQPRNNKLALNTSTLMSKPNWSSSSHPGLLLLLISFISWKIAPPSAELCKPEIGSYLRLFCPCWPSSTSKPQCHILISWQLLSGSLCEHSTPLQAILYFFVIDWIL